MSRSIEFRPRRLALVRFSRFFLTERKNSPNSLPFHADGNFQDTRTRLERECFVVGPQYVDVLPEKKARGQFYGQCNDKI